VHFQRTVRDKMCRESGLGNNGAFSESNRSRAVSFTKAFSRMVAVISYLRFDSDSLGSMVVNSSVAHNLRCTGVATFRAKRIGLDLSGNPTNSLLKNSLFICNFSLRELV
jgi:hypothetical protein